MSKTEQLTIPAATEALATVQTPSVAQMMNAMIERGITHENASALEKLVDLHIRIEERDAEKAFNAAFVALQQELPVIVAESIIPNRGRYAKFENVMHQIGDILVKNGFSVSFTQSTDKERVVQTCHLRHVGGHSQSNSFAVRVGKADSETQADCKASTTAKRNALLNCLNIVVRQDILQDEEGNVAIEGALISPEECQYLRETVAETGSNEVKFLAMAGVERFEDIRKGSYGVLSRALEQKKRAK